MSANGYCPPYHGYAGGRTAYRPRIPPALISIDGRHTGIVVTGDLESVNNYNPSTSIYKYPTPHVITLPSFNIFIIMDPEQEIIDTWNDDDWYPHEDF